MPTGGGWPSRWALVLCTISTFPPPPATTTNQQKQYRKQHRSGWRCGCLHGTVHPRHRASTACSFKPHSTPASTQSPGGLLKKGKKAKFIWTLVLLGHGKRFGIFFAGYGYVTTHDGTSRPESRGLRRLEVFAFSPQQLPHTIPSVPRAWVVGLMLAPSPARAHRRSQGAEGAYDPGG